MTFDKDNNVNITKQEEKWNEIMFSNIHHRLSDITPKAGNPKTKSVSARDIQIKSGEVPHTYKKGNLLLVIITTGLV